MIFSLLWRIVQFLLALCFHMLSFIAGGVVVQLLNGRAPFAGQMAAVAFLMVWFFGGTALVRIFKRTVLRRHATPLTRSQVGGAYVLAVVVVCEAALAWTTSDSRDAWTVATGWLLFLIGVTCTGADVNPKAESAETVIGLITESKRTLVTVEGCAPGAVIEAIVGDSRLRVSCEPTNTRTLGAMSSLVMGPLRRNIVQLNSVHNIRAALKQAQRDGTDVGVAATQFIMDYAITAWRYVQGRIGDREWHDYQAELGKTIDEVVRANTQLDSRTTWLLCFELRPSLFANDGMLEVRQQPGLSLIYWKAVQSLMHLDEHTSAIVRLIHTKIDAATLVDPTRPYPLPEDFVLPQDDDVVLDSEKDARWFSVCRDMSVPSTTTAQECYAQLTDRYARVYTAKNLAQYHKLARRSTTKRSGTLTNKKKG